MVTMFILIISLTQINENIPQEIQDTFLNLQQVINTPQYQQAQQLFNEKKYEEAMLLLSNTAVNNPDLQLPFVTSMYILTQQINDNNERIEALKKYIEISEQIKDSISIEAKKQLLSDMAEAKSIIGNKDESEEDLNELLREAGDNTTTEYANYVFQLATTVISSGNYNKAMLLLEDLRRHKSNYPEDIQDKVDHQLFNVYFNMKKTNFIIKLGEEIRQRFQKRGIDNWEKAEKMFNILKNLGDTYYLMEDYENAYKVYEEFEELYKRFKPPTGNPLEQIFPYLASDVARNKKACLLIIKGIEETQANEREKEKEEDVTKLFEYSKNQPINTEAEINQREEKKQELPKKKENDNTKTKNTNTTNPNSNKSTHINLIFIMGGFIILFLLGILFLKRKNR